MDTRRFDGVLSAVAESGSRRRLARLLGGAGLAALLGGPFAVPAAADRDDKKRRRKKRRRKNPPSPGGVCAGKVIIDDVTCSTPATGSCSPAVGCRCIRAAEGGSVRCAQTLGMVCPTADECDTDADCTGTNEACVQVGGCCGGTTNNVCMPLCVLI